jgi:hypothetical protein
MQEQYRQAARVGSGGAAGGVAGVKEARGRPGVAGLQEREERGAYPAPEHARDQRADRGARRRRPIVGVGSAAGARLRFCIRPVSPRWPGNNGFAARLGPARRHVAPYGYLRRQTTSA